tara:strand:- start:5480 stop:5803 length:324 start_codon:yes stop_codon:yes gene_type:complete
MKIDTLILLMVVFYITIQPSSMEFMNGYQSLTRQYVNQGSHDIANRLMNHDHGRRGGVFQHVSPEAGGNPNAKEAMLNVGGPGQGNLIPSVPSPPLPPADEIESFNL